MDKKKLLVIQFDQLRIGDVPIAGGKNASLGEMYRELKNKGVKVPNGFAVTAFAYRSFLEETGLKQKIKSILSDLNTKDTRNLMTRGKNSKRRITSIFTKRNCKEL
jgi:pyruvate,water dikinase